MNGLRFSSRDIIEYADEYFEVKSNNGIGGAVYKLNHEFERTGLEITSFYWSAYGEDCKLVKRKGS